MMGSLYHPLLLALFCVYFHGFSMVACSTWDKYLDGLEENSLSLKAMLDQNGEWEAVLMKNFDSIASPNNSRINMKRQLVEEQGRKKLVLTLSMKCNVDNVVPGPLRFYAKGARNAMVFKDGKSVRRNREMAEKGYGGILSNRPLQDDEIFEVRIEKLAKRYFSSLGIGVSRRSPKDVDYSEWMSCGTIMLYNTRVYDNGAVTKNNLGPNLLFLQVGATVGVMKKRNGEIRFFVNGRDVGVGATGINYPVYGVLDLYGNAVEASLMDLPLLADGGTLLAMEKKEVG